MPSNFHWSEKKLFSALVTLPSLALFAAALASCSQNLSSPGVVSEWNLYYPISLPEGLNRSRLSKSACFQWQVRLSQKAAEERVVAAPGQCPTTPEIFGEGLLTLEVERVGESAILKKAGSQVGLLRPVRADATGGSPISYSIVHLCQFSDPAADPDDYFRSVCSLEIDPGTEKLVDLTIRSPEQIFGETKADKEDRLKVILRLEAERAQLSDQLKRLQEHIRTMENHVQNDARLEDNEKKMESLRGELQLPVDATPEQISTALTKQNSLIRQLSRELADLRKSFDLPKEASFEEVLKAIQAAKKQNEKEPSEVSPTEPRKDAPKLPIND